MAGWVSETGVSTVSSTVLTRVTGFTQITEATAATETDVLGNSQFEHLVPPDPPQPLNSGRPFCCPFCGLEIIPGVQIKETEDWNKHVYMDLQPYMCTFEGCERSHKTYAIREEWFQHELECHRLKEVWFCGLPSCRSEMETMDAFENHVRSAHEVISPCQLSLMADTCKRYSQKPLTNLPCLLCGCPSVDTQTLKQHIAHHVEQYALRTAFQEGHWEFEDASDDDEKYSHVDSEKDSLVADFVDEQAIRVGLFETNI